MLFAVSFDALFCFVIYILWIKCLNHLVYDWILLSFNLDKYKALCVHNVYTVTYLALMVKLFLCRG